MDKRYKVVIVEDEPYAAAHVKSVVQQLPEFYIVALFENGEEAVEALRRTAVDVVITDIQMPGLSGLEMLEQLRQIAPETVTLLITGYSLFEYAQQAVALQVTQYILKPINNAQLIAALHDVAEKLREKEQHKAASLLLQTQRFSESVLDSPERALEKPYYEIGVFSFSAESDTVLHACRELALRLDKDRLRVLMYRNAIVFLEEKEQITQPSKLPSLARQCCQTFAARPATGLFFYSAACILAADVPQKIKAFYHKHQTQLIPGRCTILEDSTALVAEHGDVHQQTLLLGTILRNLNAKNMAAVRSDYARIFRLFVESGSSVEEIKHTLYAIVVRLYQLDSSMLDPAIEMNKIMKKLYTAQNYAQAQAGTEKILEPFLIRKEKGETEQGAANTLFCKIVEYLHFYLHQNPSLQELSDTFHVSQPYMSKLFRTYSGCSYKEYFTNLKIKTAIEIMRHDPEVRIKDIAERLGYDQMYFSSVFYRVVGEYPKEHRKKMYSNADSN